jgi:hypothetical protein
MKSHAHELVLDGLDETIRHVRDQQILPGRQAQLAGTIVRGDVREPAHLPR